MNIDRFKAEVATIVDKSRVYTDELRRLAWGTDAGFYKFMPQVILRSKDEGEVSAILKAASKYKVPVTFRAAGTSLSGQSVTDSVLVVAGKNWEQISTRDEGRTIRLQPGVIGSKVNDFLSGYGRKFGPDPASIKSAMVGGIVMNNASGMNCGTHANSDKVMLSARIVLADGTILDTGDPISRASFEATHADFLQRICELRDEIRANQALTERIRYKYSIKNVTGLNLLPLITFSDPFDIILHLMVGSEGTLGFLSEVLMNTLKIAVMRLKKVRKMKMIKCPYCGSTAQVKKNIPHTDKNGNYITAKYVCGCGTYFDEELNFLYEDKESGERFFVQCTSAAEAETILLEEGFDLVTGGTDNHLMLADLRPMQITGKELQSRLDENHITLNKNAIPADPQKPTITSGVRIGTAAVTTRGLGEPEMKKIAHCIALTAKDFEGTQAEVRATVAEICEQFPMYK